MVKCRPGPSYRQSTSKNDSIRHEYASLASDSEKQSAAGSKMTFLMTRLMSGGRIDEGGLLTYTHYNIPRVVPFSGECSSDDLCMRNVESTDR